MLTTDWATDARTALLGLAGSTRFPGLITRSEVRDASQPSHLR